MLTTHSPVLLLTLYKCPSADILYCSHSQHTSRPHSFCCMSFFFLAGNFNIVSRRFWTVCPTLDHFVVAELLLCCLVFKNETNLFHVLHSLPVYHIHMYLGELYVTPPNTFVLCMFGCCKYNTTLKLCSFFALHWCPRTVFLGPQVAVSPLHKENIAEFRLLPLWCVLFLTPLHTCSSGIVYGMWVYVLYQRTQKVKQECLF